MIPPQSTKHRQVQTANFIFKKRKKRKKKTQQKKRKMLFTAFSHLSGPLMSICETDGKSLDVFTLKYEILADQTI